MTGESSKYPNIAPITTFDQTFEVIGQPPPLQPITRKYKYPIAAPNMNVSIVNNIFIILLVLQSLLYCIQSQQQLE